MKPLVFSKDSWHYRLAVAWGGMSEYDDVSDICRYTRAVLKGMLKTGLIGILALAMTYWVTITVVWWVVGLQYGFIDEPAPVVLSLVLGILTLAALVSDGIPWLVRKIVALRRPWPPQRSEAKTDTFITKAYRSWKEKTCVRVNLIAGGEDSTRKA